MGVPLLLSALSSNSPEITPSKVSGSSAVLALTLLYSSISFRRDFFSEVNFFCSRVRCFDESACLLMAVVVRASEKLSISI